MLDHVDDRAGSARRQLLPGAQSVDFLDQLRLDPDVDFCDFSSHGGCRWGVVGHARLINPAKKLISSLSSSPTAPDPEKMT